VSIGIRPLPSNDLIWRVTGSADPTHFDSSGRQSVADIQRALAAVGSDLTEHGVILDFGCGCGRVLRWLDEMPSASLHGCDIDAQAIAWVSENLSHVRAVVNDTKPPLPYEDDYFDLVYNHSVFTHLPEDYQDFWLPELGRVVRKGGLLVLSISGDHPFTGFVDSWRNAGADPSAHVDRYREHGHVYISDDSWKGGPFPDFYHSAFHAPWYVFEHWSRYLELNAYIVRGALDFQDVVVLRPHD
jgi:SAM-dependent methyltransferase